MYCDHIHCLTKRSVARLSPYLKRKLASKGGIRREKLPLYLGEYVWRYNHRNDSDKMKVKRILELLEREVSG